MFLTTVDVHNTNEKKYLKKNNFASNEAIKLFGSQRFLWVGRKGETCKTSAATWSPVTKLFVFFD
jgi:hypothetical protein